MPAPETAMVATASRAPELGRVRGLRVVAEPAALDHVRWLASETAPGGVLVLRFAPDEAFAIGALDAVDLAADDPHAIIAEESGFVAAWCDLADLAGHTEWAWPHDRPVLAQGAIAGVPVKLWLPDDGPTALLVVAAAHADDLRARLGWDR